MACREKIEELTEKLHEARAEANRLTRLHVCVSADGGLGIASIKTDHMSATESDRWLRIPV
jgi:hypothetical protein